MWLGVVWCDEVWCGVVIVLESCLCYDKTDFKLFQTPQ